VGKIQFWETMMADDINDRTVARRGFLKALGLGVGAAATTAVAVTPSVAVAAESDADKLKARYKETDHVKAFYRTNKY
jgi:secreted PhoX family phosphatase